jgi:hypothetical protein
MAMADPTVEAWQRAKPRCLLTGELLRDDTPKMRLRVLNPSVGSDDPIRYGPSRRSQAAHRVIDALDPLAYIAAAIAADAAESDGDADV